MDEQSYRLIIGPRADYYLKKWSEVGFTSRMQTWNWAGFVFSYAWLVYRRMYHTCGLFLFLSVLATMVSLIFNLDAVYVITLHLMPLLLIGYFGNRLYQIHIDNKLLSIYQRDLPEPKLKKLLKQEGGVDFSAVVAFIFIFAVLYYGIFLWLNIIPEEFMPRNLWHILF